MTYIGLRHQDIDISAYLRNHDTISGAIPSHEQWEYLSELESVLGAYNSVEITKNLADDLLMRITALEHEAANQKMSEGIITFRTMIRDIHPIHLPQIVRALQGLFPSKSWESPLDS